MARFANLKDRPFGELTVIRFAGKAANGNMQWFCECSCGNTKTIYSSNLLGGQTISCGCVQKRNRIKHGHAANGKQSQEYVSWAKMHRRCSEEGSEGWENYGGRGITICSRWTNFLPFLEDMGLMPGKGYTIERKDNDGNYEPDNCKWATRKEQANNRRDNQLVTYLDKTLTIMQWSELTGIRFSTLQGRLSRGWSAERALTQTPNRGRRQRKFHG